MRCLFIYTSTSTFNMIKHTSPDISHRSCYSIIVIYIFVLYRKMCWTNNVFSNRDYLYLYDISTSKNTNFLNWKVNAQIQFRYCWLYIHIMYIKSVSNGWQWHIRHMKWQQYMASELVSDVNGWTRHILLERMNISDMSLPSITYSML